MLITKSSLRLFSWETREVPAAKGDFEPTARFTETHNIKYIERQGTTITALTATIKSQHE